MLLQGGLHPKLDITFYEELFSTLKHLYPNVRLHALGPPEVAHIARISGLTVRRTLERLVAAGLDSLPGAGAEILVEDVRRRISPAKPSAAEWIEVMHEAHMMNLPTSATMMYGHVETPRQRIDHLLAIRDLQARCPKGNYGFLRLHPVDIPFDGNASRKRGCAYALLTIGICACHCREPSHIVQHTQCAGFVAHRRRGHEACTLRMLHNMRRLTAMTRTYSNGEKRVCTPSLSRRVPVERNIHGMKARNP